MQLAKEAYEAYANHAGWKSLATGQPLQQWEALPEAIQKAWTVSTVWVVGNVSGQHDWRIPVKDRFIYECIQRLEGCHEVIHKNADELLCDLLLELGCEETVKAFRALNKCYS